MKRSKIMDKIVVIVNGCGGVGKDTFCDLVGKYINCITVSSNKVLNKLIEVLSKKNILLKSEVYYILH